MPPDSSCASPDTRIYLIRHPAVAVQGRCYGQSDVPLAEPVDGLALRLRQQLPTDFTLLSSPLTRCRQLADALGTPRLDPRLMEINFGTWEMRCWDSIERSQIDAWAGDTLGFAGHGGESVLQMAERAIASLQEALAGTCDPLVIVSHGGPLRALQGYLQGLPASAWSQLAFGLGELRTLPRPPG